MKTPVEQNGRAMWTCRPTPSEVAAILSNLEPTGSVVTVPTLVVGLIDRRRVRGRSVHFGTCASRRRTVSGSISCASG